jgi:mannosyltransferase OCH1-like enzyme
MFLRNIGNKMYRLVQCWIDHGTNSSFLYSCYQSARKFYTNYHCFSDFEMKQFLRQHYDENVIHQYDNIIPGAFKSDFFRYLYLYIYGGLYVDISTTHYVNLFEYFQDIFPKDFTFISVQDDGHPSNLYNAIIMCIPRHPILKYCIDMIMNLKKSDRYKCLSYTGPGLLGYAAKKYPKQHELYLDLYHKAPYIYDKKGNKLMATKFIEKKPTKKMYKESNLLHYTTYCLVDKILKF